MTQSLRIFPPTGWNEDTVQYTTELPFGSRKYVANRKNHPNKKKKNNYALFHTQFMYSIYNNIGAQRDEQIYVREKKCFKNY